MIHLKRMLNGLVAVSFCIIIIAYTFLGVLGLRSLFLYFVGEESFNSPFKLATIFMLFVDFIMIIYLIGLGILSEQETKSIE